jgi:hypothetical protein
MLAVLLAVRSTPSSRVPWPRGRAFADGRFGAWVLRRADGVSLVLDLLARCAAQAQGCAVAQVRAPASALVRHARNQARRDDARDLAGRRPRGRRPGL